MRAKQSRWIVFLIDGLESTETKHTNRENKTIVATLSAFNKVSPLLHIFHVVIISCLPQQPLIHLIDLQHFYQFLESSLWL
ncbi:unnamed protein product [Lactuca virosa]|uniref:Uncharacterized protein n=1 Tax=Lactuca virosa TaxID=75947 RepID=A0AAU9MD88_9ASTR|nr:unnamed protein product [Lactuca virosa]